MTAQDVLWCEYAYAGPRDPNLPAIILLSSCSVPLARFVHEEMTNDQRTDENCPPPLLGGFAGE